jgi:ComF family protein
VGGRRPTESGRPALSLAERLGDAVLDLLFPRHCVACGGAMERGRTDVVCGRCWAAVAVLAHPQCARCGHPLVVRDLPASYDPGPRRCRWCDLLPPYVRAVRSVCWAPEGPGGAVVHALKYEGWTAVADGMAARMARLTFPPDVRRECAALVPVPLAGTRLRERGYNQSALLADALGARWRCPVWPDAVRRVRATASQTRLTPGERLRNVARAFGVDAARHRGLRGAHVVLVDDVVTTAATLNACAAALIEGGARIVSYVTFGRARS